MARTVFGRTPDLPDPGAYPVAMWEERRQKYWRYWQHFDGDWLEETVSADDTTLKYPLKLNPLNMACMLHAGFLFGEVQDGNDPLVQAVIEPWARESKEQERDTAARLTDLVNRVWYENGGRALQQEGGLIAQILGGCVYGVAYDPSLEADGRLPIRIDLVMPEYFFPVPAFNQYWHLLEAIICFEISSLQARLMYGVETSSTVVLYQEHWRDDYYEVTADGTVVTWAGHRLSGRPVGGRVPYIYIPHIRAGDFYGVSLLEGKEAIAREINERFADVGDIVSENARILPFIRDAQKVSVRRPGYGVTLLDLGKTVPGMNPPDVIYPRPVQTNQATIDWAVELLNLARTEAYTPPIVYGIDEGSQRSALTLALRTLPLLVHVRQERTMWTSGLDEIDRMILAVAAEKGVEGITPEQVRNVKIWQEWAPVLPRDREQLINEMILRLNAGLISPETALNKLGDIRDLQTEMNLIKAWLEYKASLNVPEDNPFSGTGMGGEQANAVRPDEPTPTIEKGEQ